MTSFGILDRGEPMVMAPVPERCIPDNPSVGVVIGVYGSPAYLHLQLESARRHYDVPILVHDDCSGRRRELVALVKRYQAEFTSTPFRLGHFPGDVAACAAGLLFAERHGLDLLVKISQRCLPTKDWRPALTKLAVESQYSTYSNECIFHKFGFRSEMFAMHVNSWLPNIEDMNAYCLKRVREPHTDNSAEVESLLHNLCRRVHYPCLRNQEYTRTHKRTCVVPGSDSFGVWPFLGDNRHWFRSVLLWHDCCGPHEYHVIAENYGLPYRLEDFQ